MVAREELVDFDGVEIFVYSFADSGFAISAFLEFIYEGVIAYIFVTHISSVIIILFYEELLK